MSVFNKPRLMSAAVGAALVLSAAGAAGFAQASSLTSAQIQSIVNLLQVFGADSATVANVQAVLEGQSTSGAQASSTSIANSDNGASGSQTSTTLPNGCTVISNGLHMGSTDQESDGEVSKLQQFLSQDKNVYPEGLVTGYFGPITEDAVQRWQATHSIVATGTPATTGFGVVGPQTRGEMDKEMETECEQGDMHSSDSSRDVQTSATSSTPSQDSGTGDN